ncbi:lipoprotein insertase outer membrane protein LolB [Amphritea japonica]|uniref:Outer-membrane lipoprotein LolB n=1 Tax=Amphritea japonica ATCC BAA-1530 TaxID=1278309 RepID=A0A7R6SUC0_9GAMM|nr:lipoprotein insertase outer membrane protein LolB [Amphritea japonica]BBB27527.1 outer membrane lipoprotein LolB [Amphritea japonica ATCC BAA-1530]
MSIRTLILSITLLLSGCSGLTTTPDAPPPSRSWDELQQALLSADNWQLRGKIGIRTTDQNQSANLYWQQLQQHYQIELTGPLGQGGARIEGNNEGITINIAGEEPLWAASPERLMEQTLGWQFPVRELLYWARGIPAPDQPFELTLSQQRAQKILQNNWEINYLRFSNQQGYSLPEKIIIRQNDLRFTIIAKEWQIKL